MDISRGSIFGLSCTCLPELVAVVRGQFGAVELDLALLSQLVLGAVRCAPALLSRWCCGLLGQLDARPLRTAGTWSSFSAPLTALTFTGLVSLMDLFEAPTGFGLITCVAGIFSFKVTLPSPASVWGGDAPSSAFKYYKHLESQLFLSVGLLPSFTMATQCEATQIREELPV